MYHPTASNSTIAPATVKGHSAGPSGGGNSSRGSDDGRSKRRSSKSAIPEFTASDRPWARSQFVALGMARAPRDPRLSSLRAQRPLHEYVRDRRCNCWLGVATKVLRQKVDGIGQ